MKKSTAEDDVKIGAFLTPEMTDMNGLKLRPFSAGSYLICQRRGLSMFTGEAPNIDPDLPMESQIFQTTVADQLWQMTAFLYLHAAPMTDVLIASGNDEAFRSAVDAFAFTLSPTIFSSALEQITRLCQQVGSSAVAVEPKPTAGTSQESAPPNS